MLERGACGFKLKTLRMLRMPARLPSLSSTRWRARLWVTGDDPTIVTPITITTALISKTAGDAIRPQLAAPVNVTFKRDVPAAADPEPALDGRRRRFSPAASGRVARHVETDLSAGNPGKVSDAQYTCAASATAANDQGGVHGNSGVPNHAYALIVDGGNYNGQSITGIGLTKAAHIYFRAMNVYQHSASDFTDHADAIEQSATDLMNAGTTSELTDGTPSGEVVTAADITQIQKAMLAVEMSSTHTGCNFPPLLAQNPPADTCGTGMSQNVIFSDDFEGNTSGWTVALTENRSGNAPCAELGCQQHAARPRRQGFLRQQS